MDGDTPDLLYRIPSLPRYVSCSLLTRDLDRSASVYDESGLGHTPKYGDHPLRFVLSIASQNSILMPVRSTRWFLSDRDSEGGFRVSRSATMTVEASRNPF